MWNRIECVAIYTEDIEKSIAFYEAVGLKKAWDTYQDEDKKWRLVGMGFPEGNTELVLKNNPDLTMMEAEIRVEDVRAVYESLKGHEEVKWIRTPFPNALGGHVAVLEAPDGNVFVLVGG